eukprot:CAMPEP_0195065180 /NCGR_PEP_ID=MMETSP0448-20130528/10911_1 /TAXON_ID=66468 /ORGANISM="Heterocapsa triquestra, Strain CCMP 448" /LENGTH=71 /DNA_ID=CAMNT_0040096251 /DNA_START=96 /DNA_END=308 /DNA_ORIENTATION=+
MCVSVVYAASEDLAPGAGGRRAGRPWGLGPLGPWALGPLGPWALWPQAPGAEGQVAGEASQSAADRSRGEN